MEQTKFKKGDRVIVTDLRRGGIQHHGVVEDVVGPRLVVLYDKNGLVKVNEGFVRLEEA